MKSEQINTVQASTKRVKIGCTIIGANELHKIFKGL